MLMIQNEPFAKMRRSNGLSFPCWYLQILLSEIRDNPHEAYSPPICLI